VLFFGLWARVVTLFKRTERDKFDRFSDFAGSPVGRDRNRA